MKSKIGEMLVKNGIITEAHLAEALDLQQKKNKRLGEILVELGYIKPKELLWMLSEQASIPFVELRPEMLDTELINQFPEKLLYDNTALPLYTTEDTIYIALGDPTNTEIVKKIKEVVKKEVVVSGAEPARVHELLDKFYLALQTEMIIKPEYKGKITVKITKENALVEFTDESGLITKRRLPVEVLINIGHFKEKENAGT